MTTSRTTTTTPKSDLITILTNRIEYYKEHIAVDTEAREMADLYSRVKQRRLDREREEYLSELPHTD